MSDHSISYYSTVAQVLPVLWIVLTIEFRIFAVGGTRWSNPAEPVPPMTRKWAVYGLLVLVIYSLLFFGGEYASIKTLKEDEVTSLRSLVVRTSVLLYMVVVVSAPAAPLLWFLTESFRGDTKKKTKRKSIKDR